MGILKKLSSSITSILTLQRSLEDSGERVDIELGNSVVDFAKLNKYEKSHIRRYEFAFSEITPKDIVGDMACGTAYGSAILAGKAHKVIGKDISERTIGVVRSRYRRLSNLYLQVEDLKKLQDLNEYSIITSFETLEHFDELDILQVLNKFNTALKKDGKLIFSTPYMQKDTEKARKMGFHLTFNINEDKILKWLMNSGFSLSKFYYQDYQSHDVKSELEKPNFIIGMAHKL